MNNSQIIIYQNKSGEIKLDVRFDGDTEEKQGWGKAITTRINRSCKGGIIGRSHKILNLVNNKTGDF